MRRRTRARRVLKWVGTVLSLTLAGIAVLSLKWSAGVSASDGYFSVQVSSGGVVYISQAQHPKFLGAQRVYGQGWHLRKGIGRSGVWESLGVGWWPRLRPFGAGRLVSVPLWMPAVIVGLLTAYSWWRDRRRIPAGHCRQCGYDLTGNVSGRCSECGEAV